MLGLTWLNLVAARVVVLGRIVIIDFQRQKIGNDHVIQLLPVGLTLRALDHSAGLDAALAWQSSAMSAALLSSWSGFGRPERWAPAMSIFCRSCRCRGDDRCLFPFAATFLLFAVLTCLEIPRAAPWGQCRDHVE